LDINFRGAFGHSYLIAATFYEHWSLVKPLLKRNIQIDLGDVENTTAIMYSAFCGHSESVAFLIHAGADTSLSNNRGYTALDLAEKGQRQPDKNKVCGNQGNYERTKQLLRGEVQIL